MALCLAFGAGARGQDRAGPAAAAGAGRVVAFACGAFQPNSPIEVEALDDTPSQLALRKAIARALAQRGFTVTADAKQRLTFEDGMSRDLTGSGRRPLGELDANNDTATFRLNMWSSQGNSVLGGGNTDVPAGQANEYRLSLFVHDRSNGRCLWQGEARHAVVGNDGLATARKLVPVLLDRLGRTVKPTAFELPE